MATKIVLTHIDQSDGMRQEQARGYFVDDFPTMSTPRGVGIVPTPDTRIPLEHQGYFDTDDIIGLQTGAKILTPFSVRLDKEMSLDDIVERVARQGKTGAEARIAQHHRRCCVAGISVEV